MMLKEEDYLEAYRRYKDMKRESHERQRCHGLLLLSDGYAVEEVVDILKVEESTIWNWIHRYREAGLEGLEEGRGGEHGQSWLTADELKKLDALLTSQAAPGGTVGSGWTLKQVIKKVAEEFKVKYSKTGMKKVLKKMGWSYQRARARYIKRDPEKAEKEFEKETKKKLAQYAESRKKVIPVAEDETKVRLEATIGRL